MHRSGSVPDLRGDVAATTITATTPAAAVPSYHHQHGLLQQRQQQQQQQQQQHLYQHHGSEVVSGLDDEEKEHCLQLLGTELDHVLRYKHESTQKVCGDVFFSFCGFCIRVAPSLFLCVSLLSFFLSFSVSLPISASLQSYDL